MTTRGAVSTLGAAGLAFALAWFLWNDSADDPDGHPVSSRAAPSTEEESVAARPPTDAKKNAAQIKIMEAMLRLRGASDGGRDESAPLAETEDRMDREDRKDLRFQVRWGQQGFCAPKDARRLAARSALLKTFVAAEGSATRVFYDPSVSPRALNDVQGALNYAMHDLPTGSLEPRPAPVTYVYRDADQMLNVSCVNRSAIGYFDGAMHVVGDSRYGGARIHETVVHEYVHFLLLERGVRLPMWLHEGMAMEYSMEHWWEEPSLGLMTWLVGNHIPFREMAKAFPSISDEKFAVAAYYQSQMMFRFAFRGSASQNTLRDKGAKVDLVALLEGLAQGRVRDSEAFSMATGLSGEALERAWSQFLVEEQRLYRALHGASLMTQPPQPAVRAP